MMGRCSFHVLRYRKCWSRNSSGVSVGCGEIINSPIKWLQIKGYVGLAWAWARDSDLRVMDSPRPGSPWRA